MGKTYRPRPCSGYQTFPKEMREKYKIDKNACKGVTVNTIEERWSMIVADDIVMSDTNNQELHESQTDNGRLVRT